LRDFEGGKKDDIKECIRLLVWITLEKFRIISVWWNEEMNWEKIEEKRDGNQEGVGWD
jgi:hypothetical protein